MNGHKPRDVNAVSTTAEDHSMCMCSDTACHGYEGVLSQGRLIVQVDYWLVWRKFDEMRCVLGLSHSCALGSEEV